ncbi:MAG: Rid family detoxifying hydrolase [Candidatus Thermoplasmatota archaeon]
MPGGPSAVSSEEAPRPVGPYSQAVVCDGLLFISGQLGMDPRSGSVVEGGAAAQADAALRNVGAILRAAGAGPEDVVKVSVYLRDMGDFPAVNEVYARFFFSWKPARTTVGGLHLPKGALVEIDAVARIP